MIRWSSVEWDLKLLKSMLIDLGVAGNSVLEYLYFTGRAEWLSSEVNTYIIFGNRWPDSCMQRWSRWHMQLWLANYSKLLQSQTHLREQAAQLGREWRSHTRTWWTATCHGCAMWSRQQLTSCKLTTCSLVTQPMDHKIRWWFYITT